MAYGRMYKPYKKYGNKRTKSSPATSMQLYKDVKMLKGLVNAEHKVIDTSLGGSVSSTGVIYLINGISRGTDYNQLTGRSARFKSVQVSFRFVHNASAVVTSTRINYALVLDRQPNQAVFTLADLYSNAEARFRNLDYRLRFQVLHEGNLIVDADDPAKIVNFYKKLNIHTIYDDTNAGTIADIRTNALYLVTWSSQTDNPADMAQNVRVRFLDN